MRLRGARLLVLAAWAAAGAWAQEAAPAPTWRAAIDHGRDRVDAALGGVQLAAFGDVLSDQDGEGRRRVDFHAFELDLTRDLGDDLQVAAAGVQELNDALTALLDAGTLRYLLLGADDRLVRGADQAFGPVKP